MLDQYQTKVLNAILSGHNVVLVGQAGTGKSFTIKESVKCLRLSGKSVSVCSYTGIACLQFQDLQPMTLHHFAGLEDGHHCNEKLVTLIKNDERFLETKHRIIETDTIFIDEASMVSKKILESVEYVCRKIRRSKFCFGEMQVVLSGDFYQLPPIHDMLYGDNGKFCFEAGFFPTFFPHIFNLQFIHRQTDTDLIKCINELEMGLPSKETNDFIENLSRPLLSQYKDKTVKLFARNLDVDLYNYEQLQYLDGQVKVYEANDYGDNFYLKKMIVQKKIALKLSAKVMLLKNISSDLVNGLVGIVTELNKDDIVVNFDINGKSKLTRLSKISFTKFDPVSNVCIAKRYQFPLRLAYAITIHKSQGMSIPYLEVDCNHITNPGQLGVAVGRAVSVDGLRVINYHPLMVKKHPSKVISFYDCITEFDNLVKDVRCCQCQFSCNLDELTEFNDSMYSDTDCETFEKSISDFHKADYNAVRISMEHSYSSEFISDGDHTYCVSTAFLELKKKFNEAVQSYVNTPEENTAKQACESILIHKNDVLNWYHKQQTNIEEMYNKCCTEAPGHLKQKHFTEFYSDFHKYLTSTEYVEESKHLLKWPFSHQIITSVMFALQADLLLKESKSFQTEHSSLAVFPDVMSEISPAGKGKIRYVAGYCIAKIRYRLCRSLKECIVSVGMEQEVATLNDEIKLLDKMTISACEILSTTQYNDTLEETSFRQNICESLTNVSDTVFEFFMLLEAASRKCLTYETLIKKSKYIYKYTIETLMSDSNLFESFVKKCCTIQTLEEEANQNDDTEIFYVCDKLVQVCESILLMYEKIVRLFTVVNFSQFRKDYLRVIKREKSKALRKKVLDKKEKKNVEIVSLTSIIEDKSSGKKISHMKLKAAALEDSSFYMGYKKAELHQILRGYGQNFSTKANKAELGEQLYSYLLHEDHLEMSYPENIKCTTQSSVSVTSSPILAESEPQPGTSGLIMPSVKSRQKICKGPNTEKVKNISDKALSPEKYSKKNKKRKISCQNDSKKKIKKKSKTDTNFDEGSDHGDLCGICSKEEEDGEFWISCDSCLLWYHRDCVGLENEDEWKYFLGKDAVYLCPMCQ